MQPRARFASLAAASPRVLVLLASFAIVSLFGPSNGYANSFTSSFRVLTVERGYSLVSEGETLATGDTIHRQTPGLGDWNPTVELRHSLTLGEGEGYGRATVQSSVEGGRFSFRSRVESRGVEFLKRRGPRPGSPVILEERAGGTASVSRRAEFEITVPTTFSIVLTTERSTTGGGGIGFLQMGRAGIAAFLREPIQGEGEVIRMTGHLDPGVYVASISHHEQFINAGLGGRADPDTSIDFLLVIPEPGSALLLGMGLACLTRARRPVGRSSNVSSIRAGRGRKRNTYAPKRRLAPHLLCFGLFLLISAFGSASPAEATEFSTVRSEVVVSPQYSLSSDEGHESRRQFQLERNESFGDWSRSLEGRMQLDVGAGEATGGVVHDSTVSATRLRFASELEHAEALYRVPNPDYPSEDGLSPRYLIDELARVVVRSEVRVEFEVTVPTAYSIILKGEGVAAINTPFGFQIPTILLSDGAILGGNHVVDLVPPDGETIRLAGVLEPATYNFMISHWALPGDRSTLDVLFVIPEPRTAMLLGLGLGLASLSLVRPQNAA